MVEQRLKESNSPMTSAEPDSETLGHDLDETSLQALRSLSLEILGNLPGAHRPLLANTPPTWTYPLTLIILQHFLPHLRPVARLAGPSTVLSLLPSAREKEALLPPRNAARLGEVHEPVLPTARRHTLHQ